jgi:ribonuclease Z
MPEEVYRIEDSHCHFEINNKGWYLKGWSRAGLKTGFLLYPFKILFDCGIYTSSKPDIVFLTHQHIDHVQNIAHICTRHKPTRSVIYLPESSVHLITKYERIISELGDKYAEQMSDAEILEHQNMKLIGVNPGDIFNINTSIGQSLHVEVLRAYHRADSNGYGFSSWKKIIKPEYAELIVQSTDSIIKQERINKIKQLKNEKIEMYNTILNPEFAFFCDSTIQNLTEEIEWKKYPVIICECTGLDVSINANRDYVRNHTSINKLKPIMLDNIDKKWFLIHVSMGCSNERIRQIECELINEGINVQICY